MKYIILGMILVAGCQTPQIKYRYACISDDNFIPYEGSAYEYYHSPVGHFFKTTRDEDLWVKGMCQVRELPTQ